MKLEVLDQYCIRARTISFLDSARLKSSLKSCQMFSQVFGRDLTSLAQVLAKTWNVLSKSRPKLYRSCESLGQGLTSLGSRIEHCFYCWLATCPFATCWNAWKLSKRKKKYKTTRRLPQSSLDGARKNSDIAQRYQSLSFFSAHWKTIWFRGDWVIIREIWSWHVLNSEAAWSD